VLTLFNATGDVLARLTGIRRAADDTPFTSQYQAARELRERWTSDLVAFILDRAISGAMWRFYNRSSDLLPEGADAMRQYTEYGPGKRLSTSSRTWAN
jgi:hypothetical protein